MTHADGITGPIESAIGGECLDTYLASPGNVVVAIIGRCTGTEAQKWALPGDNTLRTRGECLTAGAKSAGADVTLARCTGSARQFWEADGAISVPEKELVNPWSGKCLEDPHGATAHGTKARLSPCHRSAAQTWYLPPDKR